MAAAAALILVVVAVVLALAGTLNDHGTHAPGAGRAQAATPGGRRADPRTRGAGTAVGSSTATTGRSTTSTGEPAAATGPAPPPVLTPAVERPQTPAEHKLEAALAKWLHVAGPNSGVLVFDLSDQTELYGERPGYGRPPASVEKLWTTTAVLNRLGADFRLDTTVLGTGHLSHGVWHGNLYLHGGGDPTFGDSEFNHVWNDGYGPTPNELIAQLRRRGIHRVTGRVFGDESLFDHRRGGLITNYASHTLRIAHVPAHVLADLDVASPFLAWLNATTGHWIPDPNNHRKQRWQLDRAPWVAPAGHRLLHIAGRMPKYELQSDGVVMIESASLDGALPCTTIDDDAANHLNLGAASNPFATIFRRFRHDDSVWPRCVALIAAFLRGESSSAAEREDGAG